MISAQERGKDFSVLFPRPPSFFRQFLFLLATVFSVRYLIWRTGYTLNPQAVWFFVLFLTAELLAFLETTLFYFNLWKPTRHKPLPALPDRAVDVFITTYNEPVHIVRETAVGAIYMRYPHKTYILDDGNRPEMRQLAKELGCGYFSRTTREHGKAGNLNSALFEGTTGEFIVLLDADFVPQPDLIEETIGFFADERVAIVQMPQCFYNLDSFQHQTDWKNEYVWEQQELFFAIIQPGKDYWNATLFCGTPAVARRSALEAIGGFVTGCAVEDIPTTFRLQANGYRILYYNRTLARGLAPQTFEFFAGQWVRWGRATMQGLLQENPLFVRGLSWAQRLSDFSIIYFYWMGYQKILYLFTPIFALSTGIWPLYTEVSTFWNYYGPYFLFNLAACAWAHGGIRAWLLGEQFSIIKLPLLAKGVSGFRKKDRTFGVTPKAQGRASRLLDVWPQATIATFTIGALLVGFYRLPRLSGFDLWANTVNLFWAFYFLSITLPVIRRALRKREARIAYRFGGRVDVPLVFSPANGDSSQAERGYARNLNRHGLSITRAEPIPVATLLELEIALPHYTVTALGRVVRTDEFKVGKKDTRVMNGVKFEQIASKAQDEISKYLFTDIASQQGKLLRLTTATQAGGESPEGEKANSQIKKNDSLCV
ncbi:MAG: glycosyltransferase [Acidobacteria bacterium]|nr:glycosyltransferase [Acidobacteriota bacterium]